MRRKFVESRLSVGLAEVAAVVIVSLMSCEGSSWENVGSVAADKGKRRGEQERRRWGRRGVKGEGGKVHPVDGGPAPLVFSEGETPHNVYRARDGVFPLLRRSHYLCRIC